MSAGPRIEATYRELAGVVGWLTLTISAKKPVRASTVRTQIARLKRAQAELELLLPTDKLVEEEET